MSDKFSAKLAAAMNNKFNGGNIGIADKRTIALADAAPELLRLLKSAWIDENHSGEEDNRPTWFNEAETVIAQAEGKVS